MEQIILQSEQETSPKSKDKVKIEVNLNNNLLFLFNKYKLIKIDITTKWKIKQIKRIVKYIKEYRDKCLRVGISNISRK